MEKEDFKDYLDTCIAQKNIDTATVMTVFSSARVLKNPYKRSLNQYKKILLEPEQFNSKNNAGEEQRYFQYMRCSKITLLNIKKNYLRFTDPRGFNDPYDPIIKGKSGEVDFILDVLKVKIACLTKCNTNFLMWSHYADGHKGVCVEYDLSKFIMEKKINISSVEYTHNYTIDNHPEPSIDNENEKDLIPFLKLFTTKHKNWEYEDEVRLLSNIGTELHCPINKIYLGVNITKQHEELIRYVADKHDIPIVQMKQAGSNILQVEPDESGE